MGLQGMISWLLPREDHFYDMVEQLGALGHDAALAVQKFGPQTNKAVQQTVQDIEHRADDVVRAMEDALARTFVTPLDREDLHKLTSELDDVVDLVNLTARAFVLYHVERPTEAMSKLMETLVACTALIKGVVPMLRAKRFDVIIETVRKVRALEKEADTVYRSAISDLFAQQQVEARDLLKQKETLDDLENSVDHCDKVADVLANLAVKHG